MLYNVDKSSFGWRIFLVGKLSSWHASKISVHAGTRKRSLSVFNEKDYIHEFCIVPKVYILEAILRNVKSKLQMNMYI